MTCLPLLYRGRRGRWMPLEWQPVTLVLSSLLLVLLTGCDFIGGSGDAYDTDIPASEPFDAYLGDWSPDGTKIVFQHDSKTNTSNSALYDELWIADLQSGERWKVHQGRVLSIDWSPDGKRFVFHSFTDPEYLFTVDSSGTGRKRLTGPGSPNPELEYTATGEWHPTDEELLFAIVAGEPRGISMMNPEGSNARIVVPYGIMGSWFPSGDRITYVNWDTTETPTRRRQIYMANPDGSDRKKITDLPDSDVISTPEASPDGSQIVFVYRGEDGATELFLMNKDGTNIRQLTEDRGIAARPEWHPSGEKILFTRWIPNGPRRLYILHLETLEIEPVFPAASSG